MADRSDRTSVEWPAPWMPAFLLAFRNSGNVRASCQAAGISRKEAYKQRQKLARFREAWDEALEDAADTLEAVAWQRARNGSDYLLWKLLASLRRDKFGDHVTVNVRSAARQLATQYGLDERELVAEAERIVSESAGR